MTIAMNLIPQNSPVKLVITGFAPSELYALLDLLESQDIVTVEHGMVGEALHITAFEESQSNELENLMNWILGQL